jgi:hypothetical protein
MWSLTQTAPSTPQQWFDQHRSQLAQWIHRIHWGELTRFLRVWDARPQMHQPPGATRPLPGIGFQAEATESRLLAYFRVRLVDALGAELQFRNAQGCKQHLGIILFEPDFVLMDPLKSLRGVRSRGWFDLPWEAAGPRELTQVAQIIVERFV